MVEIDFAASSTIARLSNKSDRGTSTLLKKYFIEKG
jgi:hypothetical protein